MAAFLFHPSIAVGFAGGLGLGMLTGKPGRVPEDTGRLVLRSVVSTIALRTLALTVGMYAAIGAGVAMAFVAAALTAAGVIADERTIVRSSLAGALLFGGAIGYTIGAII